jgi:hypothetical protein
MPPAPKTHPVIAVMDAEQQHRSDEVRRLTGIRDEAQRALDVAISRLDDIKDLREKIGVSIYSAPAAKPVSDKPKRTRRTKAQIAEDKARTLQAATDAGLIVATPPVRNVAAPDDEMPDIPANLKRA